MLTGNDRKLGPLTFGATESWRPIRLVYSSGGGDEEDSAGNHLTGYAFGWCAQLRMPPMLTPHRRKVIAMSWDAETVQRLGRDWYYEEHPREYGFCLSEGFLQLFYGVQTGDSSTTQDWACFLPWTQWRFIRLSFYAPDGTHVYSQGPEARFNDWNTAREACPSVQFKFIDFDNEQITATCRIEEREWHFGEGWFRWLSMFRQPKIQRSLDISFSSEVGRKKGSWKGGTVGHGINMEAGELALSAFRRYCQEHELTPVSGEDISR